LAVLGPETKTGVMGYPAICAHRPKQAPRSLFLALGPSEHPQPQALRATSASGYCLRSVGHKLPPPYKTAVVYKAHNYQPRRLLRYVLRMMCDVQAALPAHDQPQTTSKKTVQTRYQTQLTWPFRAGPPRQLPAPSRAAGAGPGPIPWAELLVASKLGMRCARDSGAVFLRRSAARAKALAAGLAALAAGLAEGAAALVGVWGGA
jgi:hypothetical protein